MIKGTGVCLHTYPLAARCSLASRVQAAPGQTMAYLYSKMGGLPGFLGVPPASVFAVAEIFGDHPLQLGRRGSAWW